MSYIRGRSSRWDESISWATRSLPNARRIHNSKVTPLICNSDRILHTTGLHSGEKDLKIWQKCLRYIFILPWGSKGKGLLWVPFSKCSGSHLTALLCPAQEVPVWAISGRGVDFHATQSSTSYHFFGFFSDRRDGQNTVQCSIHIWLDLRGRNSHTMKKNTFIPADYQQNIRVKV